MTVTAEELARLRDRLQTAERQHAVKGEQHRAADEAVKAAEARMLADYGVDTPEALAQIAADLEAERDTLALQADAALRLAEDALR